MVDDARLVGSGAFRVDRARMLAKLKEHQLPDPELFLLPWARCAALSGAASLRVDEDSDGVALRFGGRPFSSGELADPYRSLFAEEGADSARGRYLAAGLLAALNLGPVEVTSGEGAARVRLRVTSLDGETVEPAPEAWPETVMRVRCGNISARRRALEKLSGACAMLRFPVFIAGERAPTLSQGDGLRFEDGSLRGVLVPTGVFEERVVHLYSDGVKVTEVPGSFPLPAAAHLDDSFTLDASHSGIVRDERLARAFEAGRARAADLLSLVAAEQAERCRDPKLSPSQLAHSSSWLRHVAAGRLTNYAADAKTPALKALWEAPLYVAVTGRPLSLRSLEVQASRIGCVPVCDPVLGMPAARVLGLEPSVEVVWWLDAWDPCLRAVFGDKLKDWGTLDHLWQAIRG